MTENTASKPVKVVNVGVLDLRNATRETLPPGSQFVNVGMIVYDGDPAELLAGVRVVNTGPIHKSLPPGEFETIMGPVVITCGFLEGRDSPINLFAMGPIDVDPDIPVQDVEEKLGLLSAMGPISCPEHLLAAIQPKVAGAMGPVSSYRCPPSAQFVRGKVVLDRDYLGGLADGTEFAVLGNLVVPAVLDNDLIRTKLTSLYVTGRITCHAENLAAIQACLADRSKRVKTIPAGYALVTAPLTLDEAALASLPGSRLYCTRRVEVSPGTSPAVLEERLETLVCEDLVLCPASLKEAIRGKGDWFKSRLVIYEGTLWQVDGEQDLAAHHFEFLEGKATLLVEGELRIDQAIAPQTLTDSLAKVHNLGTIWCTPEQMDVLRPLLGLHDGELLDATMVEETVEPETEEAPGTKAISFVNSPYVAL